MTLDEFRALPLVRDRFPLVFSNGGRWESLEGLCSSCSTALVELRGTVEHPFTCVFIVEAWGYCRACRLLTSFQYRFHEDMGMTGKSPLTGEWVRWEPKRRWSFWRWLRGLFSV